MIVSARAVAIRQDNVDTDALYPGKYISIVEPQRAREYLFEWLDPALREKLNPGPTLLFVAENFVSGSSRKQPVSAMIVSGGETRHVWCPTMPVQVDQSDLAVVDPDEQAIPVELDLRKSSRPRAAARRHS